MRIRHVIRTFLRILPPTCAAGTWSLLLAVTSRTGNASDAARHATCACNPFLYSLYTRLRYTRHGASPVLSRLEPRVASSARILSLAAAHPPFHFAQDDLAQRACARMLGAGWERDPERAERGRQMRHLFEATRVRDRQFAVDLPEYYAQPRTTGQRMATYESAALELASAAFAATLES